MAPRARTAKSARYAVLRSLFNAEVTQSLLDGALRAFSEAGVPKSAIRVVEVPGAFELPIAALWLARSKRYAAIVALGCVIRGETPHFEFVAGEAARGLGEVALATGVPVAFGVLTTDTPDQARARSRPTSAPSPGHLAEPAQGNKGYEAALTALAMAKLRGEI